MAIFGGGVEDGRENTGPLAGNSLFVVLSVGDIAVSLCKNSTSCILIVLLM